MTSQDDIEARAAEWIARLDAEGEGASSRPMFEAWLKESTAHRVAYLRLREAWRKADALAPANAELAPAKAEVPLSAVRPPIRSGSPVYMRLAASFAVFVLLGAAAIWIMLARDTTQHYTTEIGQRSTIALSDGSKIELNTDSALRADIRAGSRTVWLDRGEAFFSVAHDSARPFVVWANGRAIKDIGTKFSVRSLGNGLDVLVEEGRVSVGLGAAGPAVLTRGDALDVSGSAVTRRHETDTDMARALAWRQGLLIFDGTALADAVAEFNRYNRQKLAVADVATGRMRIGGTFAVDNTGGFVRLLKGGFGLHENIRGETIVISR